ncbi:sec-independent protein translocase protein TATB, chloroplastic-like isoform X1 [Zingiber officinale]|uniref:sec-independent protein translocase protein TATB, chloroplastic-like isoform X1 n=1 Tax=Zingiber officinale TaxID=94328 RepID=UPI001C4D6574|nr:sec-independent protein translocase protein TATB, chloroplastic-like isoform X1 [Zingiber officinale]
MGSATVLASLCHCSLSLSLSSSSHSMKVALLISSRPPSRASPKIPPSSHLRGSFPALHLPRPPLWDGLKPLARPLSFGNFARKEKKVKFRGKVVRASLFGVGAPEALVIGVVALLVFGPKGLAEIARNLGKTLRAFQPTIRELQDVSREFKNTLEREIGIDEVVPPTNYINKSTLYADEKQETVVDPNGKPLAQSYTSEELLKVTEQQLAASSATSKIELMPESQGTASQVEEQAPKEQPKETFTTETSTFNSDTDAQSSAKSEHQR